MLFLNSAQASGIDPKEKSNTKWALNPDVNSFIYQHAAFSVPIHLWSQRRYNHKEALPRVHQWAPSQLPKQYSWAEEKVPF